MQANGCRETAAVGILFYLRRRCESKVFLNVWNKKGGWGRGLEFLMKMKENESGWMIGRGRVGGPNPNPNPNPSLLFVYLSESETRSVRGWGGPGPGPPHPGPLPYLQINRHRPSSSSLSLSLFWSFGALMPYRTSALISFLAGFFLSGILLFFFFVLYF